MQFSLAVLATLVATAVANPRPQGVTQNISPSAPAPAGCTPSRSGQFQITVINATSSIRKRDVELLKRQQSGILTLTLDNGVLRDQATRTGYIASNFQFQFDGPPQAGAIYTSGFSVCSNNTLALGGSAIWYQCYSGGFYNLYDRWWAEQCSPIYLGIIGGAPSSVVSAATTISSSIISLAPDGQPAATLAPIPVSELSDGQPQGPSSVAPAPISQISDGQPQAPTARPTTPAVSSAAPPLVTQISDGQIQATSAANGTFTRTAPASAFTGAAPSAVYQLGAIAAGLIGAAAMI